MSSEVSGEAETSGKSSQELLDEENAIMAKNDALWEKVFASMSKNVTEDMKSSNYGDVLMAAVDGAKDQFTDAEYETLKSDAEQIRKIEEEIAALPADSSDAQTSDASGTAFPQFEGKDLDGNKVDSSVFAENAVTVVNFWFNECKPCVEELSEMNALNDRIREQGGEVLGVNVGALDGDEQNIATAKQILETKGAKYRFFRKSTTFRAFSTWRSTRRDRVSRPWSSRNEWNGDRVAPVSRIRVVRSFIT